MDKKVLTLTHDEIVAIRFLILSRPQSDSSIFPLSVRSSLLNKLRLL